MFHKIDAMQVLKSHQRLFLEPAINENPFIFPFPYAEERLAF